MSDSLVPDSDLPEDAAPAAASGAVPANDLPEVPESDLPDDSGGESVKPSGDTYGGGAQQAVAGLEGLAKGVAGPLATYAETHLLGIKPEDIAGREEANPWTHGIGEAVGIGGSLLTGVGEAALIGKASEAVSGAARLGKVGSTALKGAIDAGLFQGGDEISKYILGQSDPEAPVSSALVHMGASSLLGGAGGVILGKAGSKLQELAEGKTASKAAQMLSDFGNRFEFLSKNKDIAGAATEEAASLASAVKGATEQGYALKDQAIQKLVPKSMTPEISAQNQSLATRLMEKQREMMNNPDVYSKAQSNEFGKNINKWMDVATSPEATPHEVFNATQELKQNFQYNAEYNLPPVSKHDAKFPILQAYRELAPQLRESLEDKKVWGGAAELQEGINKAYSDLKNYHKDFTKTFTTQKLDQREIDPDKISSMLRQIGNNKGALRGSKLADFIEPAQKFLQKVDDLHQSLGVESSIPKISTNVLDEMLSGNVSKGAKMADWLFGRGPGSIGWAGAHIAGTAAGAMTGHPYLGYRAGEHLAPIISEGIGRKLTRRGVEGALRALSSGNPEGVPQAIHYAEAIGKGADKIDKSVNNLFTVGGQKYLNHDFSETAREALKKYVADGTLNQQIDNQTSSGGAAPPAIAPAPSFASGGEVMAPAPTLPVAKPVGSVLPKKDHVAAVFPEQSMLLGAAKSRINGYLNQIRPQSVTPKLPFDDHMEDKAKEKSYNQALDIANKPLSIVDHIKNGTLEPDHVKHMNQLYPELSSHLQKKIMEKVADAQMKNEKPPHKVRQSLSLFMGQPLDSNLTQQNIAAAQMSFISQKPAPPAGGQNKGSTKGLSDVSNQFRTHDQSIQNRQNRAK